MRETEREWCVGDSGWDREEYNESVDREAREVSMTAYLFQDLRTLIAYGRSLWWLELKAPSRI